MKFDELTDASSVATLRTLLRHVDNSNTECRSASHHSELYADYILDKQLGNGCVRSLCRDYHSQTQC